jgi:hypothetical protein
MPQVPNHDDKIPQTTGRPAMGSRVHVVGSFGLTGVVVGMRSAQLAAAPPQLEPPSDERFDDDTFAENRRIEAARYGVLYIVAFANGQALPFSELELELALVLPSREVLPPRPGQIQPARRIMRPQLREPTSDDAGDAGETAEKGHAENGP